MKGRKLLSAVIAGAMVLGTMSFPAFAASDTLPEAVDGVIKLTEDVKLGSDFDYNANGDSLTIDLAGYSLKLTGNTILKNGVYTIKNGTVDVENVECTSGEGLIRIAPHSDDSATLNMDNVTVKANGYNAQCGLFQFETPGKLNLNKVTINAANVTDGYGVFYSSPGNPSSLTMNEVTMTVTGANKLIYGCNAVITDSNIYAQVKKDVFSAVSPVITDSTLTVEAGRAVFNDANVFITTATVINSTITPAGTLTSGIVNNTNASSKIILDSVSDIGTTEGVCTASASIGSNLYSSLADALAAAQAGDTITLLNDATLTTDYPGSKELTIDLNDNTLTMGDKKMLLSADTTIKNGKIKVELSSDNWDGIIWTWGASDIDILLENVVIDSYSEKTLSYIFNFVHTSNLALTLKDSTINVGGNTQIVFCDNAFGNGNTTTLINTTVNAEGEQVVFLHGDNFVTDGSEINAPDGTLLQGYAYSNLTINNSTVVADNTKAGTGELKIENDSDVLITGKVGVYEKEGLELPTGVNITVKDDSVLYTPVVSENVTGNGLADALIDRADKITVEFEQVEGNANEYNIVLNAENETIYEFIGAELQFVNESKTLSNADMLYTIEAADDINVVEAGDGQFGFYIKDGATTNRITAHKIILGKVVFGQQGNIKFSIKQDGNNSVQTTQYRTHLEEEYKPNVVDGLELVINSEKSSINSTVEAATRNVVVNVDFAHELDGTYWADNQITVTLKDAFGNIVGDNAYPLAIANNAGTYTFEDVPVGRITVTLKAPGFRTYTYTTTVEEGTDPLVLNFWNDTKRDTTAEVEAGKAMANNFVVGDIAMDYIVDKYDLAAVTSYYGTYGLTDTNKIKYDLNRDGDIDITDVAYVLHNFGF